MSKFERFSEQHEAKRLLDAALVEGPVHAYLFYGPPGVRKRRFARTFAQELLGTTRNVHPDLYELAALGEMIRIDAIRELRRDLHMRPFEASRRVYVIQSAHLMNEDAFDALLKDLEEPPEYAVIILVADDLGPIPATIRSRCQLVPFTRLSERAILEALDARAPALDPAARLALARVAGGSLDRRRQAARPRSRPRATGSSARTGPRCVLARFPGFEPSDAASVLLENSRARGVEARDLEDVKARALELPTREADQRVKRARSCGAERECELARPSSRSSPPGTAISSSSESERSRRRRTSTCSSCSGSTRPASGCSEPNGPPKLCATRGAGSRSFSSHRRSRSRLCSSCSLVSWAAGLPRSSDETACPLVHQLRVPRGQAWLCG